MDLNQRYLAAWTILLLIAGYTLPMLRNRGIARILAWALTLLTVGVATYCTAGNDALTRMGTIITLQLLAMKGIVMVESYRHQRGLNPIQWGAFSLGWFGMRPELFEMFPGKPRAFTALLLRGLSRIGIGLVLLYLAGRAAHAGFTGFVGAPLLTLVGLSFILHLGVLNIATALWRALGADVRELFRTPYKAMSLREFWGRRWNLAFSEMTARIAYKPLKKPLGIAGATIASFLLSGLLHEIAISLPVNAGYGLPMLYFVLHGALMQAEDKVAWVQKIITHKVLAHVWVLGWLVVPMPLLFHKPFMQGVVEPLRDLILGGLGAW